MIGQRRKKSFELYGIISTRNQFISDSEVSPFVVNPAHNKTTYYNINNLSFIITVFYIKDALCN